MKVFKVAFLPVLGKNEKQETVRVGRYMVYVSAPNASRIGAVLKHFLPELYDEGFDVVEDYEVPPGHRAWSVSIGPDNRTRSFFVSAVDEDAAVIATQKSVETLPDQANYLKMGLAKAREITLDKEGVF